MKKTLTIFVLFIITSSLSYSQWQDRLAKLAETYAKPYAQPFATAFGTAMNSGAFHSANVANLFGFSISFQGMYILIPDDQLTFTPSLPAGYTASKSSATIFGNKGAAYAGPNGYITLPGGFDITSVPMAIPQVSLSVFGTEALLRLLPDTEIGGEKYGLFGLGIKHSVSRYIPLIPIDVAVQVLYSKFTVKNYMDVKNLAFNAHASKTLGVFTPYFGLQYESTSMDVTYNIEGDPNDPDPALRTDKKISISLDGDNSFRAVIGASLKLAVIVLNADVNLGSLTTFGGGLSFEF